MEQEPRYQLGSNSLSQVPMIVSGSQRARDNARQEKGHEERNTRSHKGDTYEDGPGLGGEGEALPELKESERCMIRNLYNNPFDAGEEDAVRRHPVARLFARVAAMENGEVIMGDEGKAL